MNRSYFEELHRAERREADWRMLDAALRERRSHTFRRSVVAAVFWILRIR